MLITPSIFDETDLDLGSDAPCSLQFVASRRPLCNNSAEWACRLACCGNVKIVCNQHRDIVASVLPKVFMCVVCKAKTPGVASAWRI